MMYAQGSLTKTQQAIRWVKYGADDRVIKKAWLTGQKKTGRSAKEIEQYFLILESGEAALSVCPLAWTCTASHISGCHHEMSMN